MDILINNGISGAGLLSEGGEMLGTGLSLLLDELAYGVLVTGMNGELLYANQAARHELLQRRVLGLRNNLLRACIASDRTTLEEAMTKVAKGKRSLITLTGGDGSGLTLATIPLRARASVCESLMLRLFSRRHGLTRTEEHVLEILCQGYSAPQIAGRMNVAVSTIRSHVRSLCAKTRSSGVRELVNRVAVLPPVGPMVRYEPMH